ncbi:hypothetical protein FLL45_01670 [Aliikangiella marina]|uniref:ParB/Sulfiredoxin domain-containing protein n=1 Tax=Aliikangiella marina TaxID=1712262 RepID=A0A545THI6_9GAMM|nr:hypothetical protein [Aliikangiella marina]TQV76694.1 hypothetical protein FLL45_01670 [Aliikangiella marina]
MQLPSKTLTIKFQELQADSEFQKRFDIGSPESLDSIKRLTDLLDQGQSLERITVLESPEGLKILDGFHRFEAYKQHIKNNEPLEYSEYEIEVASLGVLDKLKALEYSCLANTKHGRGVSPESALQRLFQLMLTTDYYLETK